MNNNKQKSLTKFINCLSILEAQTYLLYKNLSDKVENPLARTFLKEIAIDSQKHSEILKGVSKSITRPKGDIKECAKNNTVLQRILELQKETAKMQKITSEDLLNLNKRLQLLESQLGEEYYVLVQMKTLTFMMTQINQSYNIDLSNMKHVFTSIISDEERHTELLETIKKIVTPKEQDRNNPLVRFQNPDAWYQPPASTL
jgi:rubrerythrin